MKRSLLNITYKDRKTSGLEMDKSRNQQCENIEMVLDRAHQPPQKTTDGHSVSSLGEHTTRKYDKGDQPNGGETSRTNTGATRSGRGRHKTG